jgi:hypothetical protein
MAEQKRFDAMCAEIAALEQRRNVPAVLAFMRRQSDSGRAQAGCQVLCSLAVHGEHAALQTHPTAECVVAVMTAHPTAVGVQEWALRLLCSLAAHSASDAAQIAAAGGIERALAAMSALSSAAVHQWACETLSRLSDYPILAARIKSLGAEDSVKRAMAAPNSTYSTKTSAKRLLAQIR